MVFEKKQNLRKLKLKTVKSANKRIRPSSIERHVLKNEEAEKFRLPLGSMDQNCSS